MRTKKSMRWQKSVSKAAARLAGMNAVRATFLVVICIMTAAILVAARRPSQPSDFVVNVRPENAPVAQASKTSAAAVVPAKTPAADATANAPAVESAGKAPAPVTITGCLELAGETFKLKDTAGADAPKARSWKSGFLKKGAASVEVVDAAHRLKLPSHVGQRVSVTGVLVEREMQARSLQRVAASCN